ncbi:MAG: GntR family transcriptional regulator [Pseudomonadota bacterium]
MSAVADPTDAYALILEEIDQGDLAPGARLVETDLAERFGMSRTPIREALQRLEAQGVVARDGRSLRVATLDHDQLGELYEVRAHFEGLAARLAARHAAPEEVALLREMVETDRDRLDDPTALATSNRRFHRQLHRASHNRYLNQILDGMRRSMALLSSTTLMSPDRGAQSLAEHDRIVTAITDRDETAAQAAAEEHISNAYRTRLAIDSGG